MSTVRVVAWIAAGCCFGTGVAFLILDLGPTAAGMWLAAAVALLVAIDCAEFVRRRKRSRPVVTLYTNDWQPISTSSCGARIVYKPVQKQDRR